MRFARLALALILLSASHAHAAWTFVSVGSFDGTPSPINPGLPSGHTSGDILIWVGFERNANNTLAIPSGYTEIASISAPAKYFVVAAKIDGGSETAPSTIPVGTAMAQVAAFRGGPTTLVGIVHSVSYSAGVSCSTNPPSPALTVTQDGTLVITVAYQSDDYTGFSSNPAGFTTVDHNAFTGSGNASLLWGYQIQTTATSISAGNFTTSGASSSTCRGLTISLVAGATGGGGGNPTITSVNTTNSVIYTDVNKTTVTTNAGASQGGSTFKIVDQGGSVKATQSIDSWSATAQQFDVVQGDVRLGTITWELVVGGNTATLPGSLTAPSGEWYTDITGLIALDFNLDGSKVGRLRGQPNRYYDYPTDLQNGDQLHCKRTGGSGNLTLKANGTFEAPSTITQIQCRKWNGGTWGSFQTWDLTGAKPTFTGPEP